MFLNIAHRGDSTNAPENTLAAFELAIEAGASAVELDIRCTADGQVVAMHEVKDSFTDPITGRHKNLQTSDAMGTLNSCLLYTSPSPRD